MITGKMTMIQARRLAVLVRRLILKLYVVEGQYQGAPMRLLIADDNDTLAYIRSLVFPDGATISRKGSISALAASRLSASDADMVVVGANQLLTTRYARNGFRIVPKYVRQILPITDHPDVLVSRLGKSTRAHIRKALAHWPDHIVTSDAAWLPRFYYDMYKPYTLKKFGEHATVCSYDRVKEDFERGALLVLTRDEQPVSAAVLFTEHDTMRMPFSGVMTGSEEIARQGAKTAMYYYMMALAHSWGCTEINLGHSRPFLSDGVLRFKMKWGTEVLDDDDGVASFAIATPGNAEQATRFFSSNPFFYIESGQLRAHQGMVEDSE